MLLVIAQSYIDYLSNNIANRIFKGMQNPIQAIFDTDGNKASQIQSNIMTPSTAPVTSKAKGGWMVEDLTDDYFSDARPPKQYFNPNEFKYRDCQRVCDGAFDVRTCSRECTCSVQ